MTKQTTPDQKENFDGLKPDELKEKFTLFREAAEKSGIDLAKELGVKTETTTETSKKLDESSISKFKDMYAFSRKVLEENGIKTDETKIDPVDAKFAEYTKTIDEKLERQAEAKFGDQVKNVTSIDKDFPIDSIKTLDIPWDKKVQVMNAMVDVATKTQKSISKLREELDNATKGLEDAKKYAPAPKETGKTGKDKILDAISKHSELSDLKLPATITSGN